HPDVKPLLGTVSCFANEYNLAIPKAYRLKEHSKMEGTMNFTKIPGQALIGLAEMVRVADERANRREPTTIHVYFGESRKREESTALGVAADGSYRFAKWK